MANEKTKKMSRVRILTECAVLLALGTVLSFVKLADLPAGGSVTCASMMPLVILAWRHGWKWGLGCGVVWGAVQQLVGLSTLSYVTTWQSILAVALLDYVVAFAVYGLAGIFRKSFKNQHTALISGAVFAGILRYLCHVISGATVWAGLSIPSSAALLYSLSYNATYMLPDTLILALVAGYVGAVIDFRRETPTRLIRESVSKLDASLIGAAGLVLLGGIVFDIVAVFTRLQSESGEFDIRLLSSVNWLAVGIVTAACVVVSLALFFTVYFKNKKICR